MVALSANTSEQVNLARAHGFQRATECICLYSLHSKNVLFIFPESYPLLISSHTSKQISLEINSLVLPKVTETTYFSVAQLIVSNINWPLPMGLGTVLSALHILFLLILTIILSSRYCYYSCVKDEQTDTHRLNNLPKMYST